MIIVKWSRTVSSDQNIQKEGRLTNGSLHLYLLKIIIKVTISSSVKVQMCTCRPYQILNTKVDLVLYYPIANDGHNVHWEWMTNYLDNYCDNNKCYSKRNFLIQILLYNIFITIGLYSFKIDGNSDNLSYVSLSKKTWKTDD